MTNDDIFNYTYTDKVIISNPNFFEPVDFFKGGEKNPCVCKDLHAKNSFAFREIFHDEHIVPINVIIKQLLSMDPTHENIKSVIGKIGVCKMLKTLRPSNTRAGKETL
ncbi:MAG: hypothetical protein PHI78_02900 [Clostridia bacterium]|nr:hypothetical protein [Clostridia bacterium]